MHLQVNQLIILFILFSPTITFFILEGIKVFQIGKKFILDGADYRTPCLSLAWLILLLSFTIKFLKIALHLESTLLRSFTLYCFLIYIALLIRGFLLGYTGLSLKIYLRNFLSAFISFGVLIFSVIFTIINTTTESNILAFIAHADIFETITFHLNVSSVISLRILETIGLVVLITIFIICNIFSQRKLKKLLIFSLMYFIPVSLWLYPLTNKLPLWLDVIVSLIIYQSAIGYALLAHKIECDSVLRKCQDNFETTNTFQEKVQKAIINFIKYKKTKNISEEKEKFLLTDLATLIFKTYNYEVKKDFHYKLRKFCKKNKERIIIYNKLLTIASEQNKNIIQNFYL